ncbi:hypothetical protein CKO28_19070 [Rhodovibrio sodomensis]|uniref:Transcriptional regulator n=1 Tax=Rhodovibrio sodomensis TaxID=1088 RepID=A0ABS1DI32_9PROT|nr:hypothetical protein [Rhodovibrio sodomensis]MBK1670141.1 hypothetical protein [Rhodovibrio sodomensis]
MARLSINDVLDFAVVFLADEAAPRLQDIPGHMRQLSGGWFCPCTDVIRGRVDALEACAFVQLPDTSEHRGQRQVHATAEGVAYARTLPRKIAPQPCLALLVWRGLQMSLAGSLTSDARSALMLELSQHEPAMPAMSDLAQDFAAIHEHGRHGPG